MIFAPIVLALNSSLDARDLFVGARENEPAQVDDAASDLPPMEMIRVGKTKYRLVRPVRPISSMTARGWTCWSRPLGAKYQGLGSSPLRALEAWQGNVHAAFQKLYAMRQFEMTDEERQDWARLIQIIDVAEYRDRAPLIMRAIGRVRYWKGTPNPSAIEWIDGRRDRIPAWDKVPADFATLKPGAWIDAVVHRHPKTNVLLRIIDARRIATVPVMSPDAAKTFHESLPEADLPEMEWTWPTLG